jgi:membrane protein implicated in regulation of membrane protease activity
LTQVDGVDLGSPWTWLIAGIILVALEMAMPGFFLIWLGLAALIIGGGNFVQRLPWEANGLLFAALAVALVFIGKRLTWRKGDDEATVMHLNQRANALIGRVTTLDQPIVSGEGRVRFDDAIWLAKGPDLPAGVKVKVVGAAGKVLSVERANSE